MEMKKNWYTYTMIVRTPIAINFVNRFREIIKIHVKIIVTRENVYIKNIISRLK